MNKRAELIVNLGQLKKNYELIESMSGFKKSFVMIKANAYGHGDAEVYEALKKFETVDGFGVASIEEAIQLRRRVKCFLKPLIVFSDIFIEDSDYVNEYAQNKIIPVISSERALKCFLEKSDCKNIPIFLKFNTGMNRLGLNPERVHEIASLLKKYDRKVVDHLMSHFSDASKEYDPASKSVRQERIFNQVKRELTERGVIIAGSSLANSAAVEQGAGFNETHIRPGLILYGPNYLENKYSGKMVSRLKSHVIASFSVKKGDEVGYGSTVSPRDGKVFIFGLGYGDGLSTSFSNKEITINNRVAKIIGRVNMDMVAIMFEDDFDPTHLGDNSIEIWGDCPENFVNFANVGSKIPYELLCGISERVTRVYKDDFGESN